MKKLIPLFVVSSALVAGCNQEQPATNNAANNAATASTPVAATPATPTTAPAEATVDKADAVAMVNGRPISKATLAALEKEIAERSHGQTFPKDKLVEELVQRELLIQDAMQKHLDASPEFTAQLENTKKALLTQADLQNFIKSNPVTDAEVKAEYDSKVAAEKGIEYKAKHILVKTEADAKKLIAELDKGGDFAKLANKHSEDAKETQNGGDLGWFSAAQMVAPFSEAVAALENGKYSKEPVKTQFGYHIILKEDSRALTPPPLEAVKDQLTPFLQRKKVQEMIETLRKQASVEILIPLTVEQPAKPEAAPAEAAAPVAEPAKATAEKTAEPAPAPAESAPAPAQTPATEEKPAATAEPAKAEQPSTSEKPAEPAAATEAPKQ